MGEHSLFDQPGRIYNVDETGLSLVPGVTKIVGKKGAKYSSQITSGERGQLQTVVMAVSAAGDYIPPMVIYKGKRANPALERGLPPSCIVRYSDSGYMNKDLFLEWMQHFCLNKRTGSGKTLLVLDGHGSHTLSLEVLQYASQHDVEVVSLPPHTSHYLQPLDKVHFKPLKDHYKEAVRVHLRNNPGVGMSRLDFPQLFAKAYFKVATMPNAIASFRTTGLHPLDIEQIPGHAFAPAETTHRVFSTGRLGNLQAGHVATTEAETGDVIASSHACAADVPSTSSVHGDSGECLVEGQAETHVLSASGVHPESEESSRKGRDKNMNDSSGGDTSFEDILPQPKAPTRSRPTRKKAINTGTRVLTSEKYRSELLILAKAREAQNMKKTSVASQKIHKKVSRKRIRKELAADTHTTGSSEPLESSDAANICGICEGNFYDDEEDEGWIQCQACLKWFHDICAGVYGRGVASFSCDNCSE